MIIAPLTSLIEKIAIRLSQKAWLLSEGVRSDELDLCLAAQPVHVQHRTSFLKISSAAMCHFRTHALQQEMRLASDAAPTLLKSP
jgi:hypothetical protein